MQEFGVKNIKKRTNRQELLTICHLLLQDFGGKCTKFCLIPDYVLITSYNTELIKEYFLCHINRD